MPNARNQSRMKLLGCFVTVEFKAQVVREANSRNMTVADFMRDVLKRELGVTDNVGTQRQFDEV